MIKEYIFIPILKVISYVLIMICEYQHKYLSDELDDKLQKFYIDKIGYHCPFVTWSFMLERRFHLGMWIVNK